MRYVFLYFVVRKKKRNFVSNYIINVLKVVCSFFKTVHYEGLL